MTRLKKLPSKLINSMGFLVFVCFLTGFICAAIVLVQVPGYIKAIKQRQIDQRRTELSISLEDLKNSYYDNGRDFYDTYLGSSFYNREDFDAASIDQYTDEDIHIYTMNQYFETYLHKDFAFMTEEDFSTEISIFIRVYEKTLSQNLELKQLMGERELLQKAIAEVIGTLKALPAV